MIWVGRLISFAALLQTIEFFWIPEWGWEFLRPEIPRFIRPLLKSNRLLLTVRLLAAIGALLFGEPLFIAILLLSTWGIAIRWRGTFNGGSDAMTFLILAAWLVAACFPSLESVCLLYVAIQLVLSYFVAGIAKAINPQWRSGEALSYFFAQSGFKISPQTSLALSWLLLLIECSFPLAFFAPKLFVIMAIAFHVANVYIFGLNRFFFAWLAAYPALFLILY
jgi:hypothetical protein